jgi:hypothetical protein
VRRRVGGVLERLLGLSLGERRPSTAGERDRDRSRSLRRSPLSLSSLPCSASRRLSFLARFSALRFAFFLLRSSFSNARREASGSVLADMGAAAAEPEGELLFSLVAFAVLAAGANPLTRVH